MEPTDEEMRLVDARLARIIAHADLTATPLRSLLPLALLRDVVAIKGLVWMVSARHPVAAVAARAVLLGGFAAAVIALAGTALGGAR